MRNILEHNGLASLVRVAAIVTIVGVLTVGGCPAPNPGGTTDPNTGGGSGDDGAGGGIEDGTDGTGGSGGTGGSDGSGGSGGADDGSGGSGADGGGDGSDTDTPAPTTITLQEIVATDDDVPGQAATFTTFGNPVIDSEGRIAFWAKYDGAAADGYGGLYVWNGSEIVKVIDDDPDTEGIVPGRETNDYFGSFEGGGSYDPLENSVVWAAGGRLIFNSRVTGETTSEGIYRWRASDADLVRVGDREQVAALFDDAILAAFSPTFYLPGVSDNGLGVFAVDYVYITAGSQFVSGTGVFTSNGTTVSVLRDSNTSQDDPGDVPDQTANTFFAELGMLTTLNPSGDVLFSGRYGAGDGQNGLYLRYRDGRVLRVLDSRSQASWPGLPSGTVVGLTPTEFATFANGPNGHIAALTRIRVDGSERDAVLLWDWSDADWEEIVGPSQASASTMLTGVNDDGKVVVLISDAPYMASRTAVDPMADTLPFDLQGATIVWDTEGGSINNAGRAALRYTHDGASGLAFWDGDEILVVADATLNEPETGISAIHTITDPQRDRPGRSGMLNDADQMTFRIVFSNGEEAIYLARGQ